MIDLERFIRDVCDCIGVPYVSPGGTGKDCSRSGIDCSGLLVRAYKLQGETLYHGSNYIWRHDLSEKGKLTSVKQLQVGMAVFKWSKSGEPDRYKSDGEGNFHHIGVVTSVNPLKITHASSVYGKVKQDDILGMWSHWGKLKAINYGNIVPISGGKPMQYKVTAASGATVNMRRSANTQSDVLVKVPVGSVVEGTAVSEGWVNINFSGVSGYMMDKFLTAVDNTPSLEERIRRLEERVQALEGGVG